MSFSLPQLPYKYSDLEPYIDATTMEIHHTKHHQTYIDNLNKALQNTDTNNLSIEELLMDIKLVPEDKKQAVINHGGGHANHSFFWAIMKKPDGKNLSEGFLHKAIEETFGSFEKFKEKFTEKALGVFGSGWAFLVMDSNKKLILRRHSFQNSPLLQGNVPLLGVDVWEHAYYLKYQNRRKDYLDAWWNVINWKEVENRFEKI